MPTGEDTHGCDYFTSLFLLPQLCNSTRRISRSSRRSAFSLFELAVLFDNGYCCGRIVVTCGRSGPVLGDPVFQCDSIDPKIGGNLLNRSTVGILVQCDRVTAELLRVGLAWHDVEITFRSQKVGISGVYQTGVRSVVRPVDVLG